MKPYLPILHSLFVLAMFFSPRALRAEAMISEFVANPASGALEDEDCETVDWIELHNPEATAIDVGGYHLSDNSAEPMQWTIPAPTEIAAGGYLLIYASGKDRSVVGSPLHANFQLAADGDDLLLVKPDGATVVASFTWTNDEPLPNGALRAQLSGVAYGLLPSGESHAFLSQPSPGNANRGSQVELEKVTFSEESGTFTEGFMLDITAPVEGAEIRFSNNGNMPDLFNGKTYNGPIEVNETTIIRARWKHPVSRVTSIIAGRHFIKLSEDAIAEDRKAGAPTLPTFESNLPVVVVETFDTASENVTEFVPVVVNLHEPVDGVTRLTDAPTVSTRAVYRLRGKSSFQFPKKQYRLELRDQTEEDKKLSLLGMAADSDWILNAPWVDKSFIRNTLVYELGRDIGMTAMGTRLVEAFVNEDGGPLNYEEDYRGVYVLTETIKRGGDRIDIERLAPCHEEEPDISGGYVVRFDKVDGPTLPGFGGLQATIPDHDEITAPQRTWISDYIRDFQSRTRGADSSDPVLGFRAVADEQSMVNIMLINEFTKEQDTYIFSHYLHKDRGGPLTFGPLWDYNLCFGAGISTTGTDNWNYSSRNSQLRWEGHVFQGDVEFRQRFIDDWTALRSSHLSVEQWNARIDRHAAPLLDREGSETGPATRNFVVWDTLGERNLNEFISPVTETYEEQIQFLKDWAKDRFDWIDDEFVNPPRLKIANDVLTMTFGSLFASGTAYYTLDGSDPRLPGGDVSPSALVYEEGITLTEPSFLTARHLLGDEWSGQVIERFVVGEQMPSSSNLIVSEIMYRPAQPSTEELAAGFTDRDDFEFLELHNLSDQSLSLFGSQFSDGINFEFGDAASASLPAGSHGVMVRNLDAFRLRYGDEPRVLGRYTGRLSNDGERLALQGGDGIELIALTYNDAWYRETDGAGQSLVLKDAGVPSDWNVSEAWSPSGTLNGTPGSGNATPPVAMPTPHLDVPISIVANDGEATVILDGDATQTYRLEVTEDLADWRPLRTSKDARLTDAAVPYHPTRYYRAVKPEEEGLLTGDHLKTSVGDVVIHPVNHASFVMQWNGKMIYNDPVGNASLYSNFPKADLILVSHEHGDHFNSGTLNAVKHDNTVIITGAAVFNQLSAALKGITTELANGESTEVIGVTVEAIPSYNGRHPEGRDNGYVLTIGDKRLYMSGDTEDIPEMRALKDIDVAFLSMNLPFTMSVADAADAVREFRPRVVYPYHFRNQDGSFSDLERFKELVGREGGVEVRIRDWY
ncbi:MAG: L-ascorbate metabolism protein UlaG (beta-lactamase superfamily) [Verrucomicrobiales bacterium]|jgi:L-ascorbate metabolism protein UlaG (beta-lactamase superfamily)